MRLVFLYLLLGWFLTGCWSPKKEPLKDKPVDTITAKTIVEKEDLYNEWGEKIMKPKEITEDEFAVIYKGRSTMHFKGYNDVEEMRMGFANGKDTLKHFENAHDLYIKKFSKEGFDFVLNTYPTLLYRGQGCV